MYYCDACLALDLRVSLTEAHEAALYIAAALPGFERRRSQCSGCLRVTEDLTPANMWPADKVPDPTAPPTPSPAPDRASTVLAARGLLEDALRKTLQRQGDRAARAAATPGKLRGFIVEFFTDAEAEAPTVARQIIDEMNQASRSELETLAKACPVDGLLREQVEDLARRWALHRPARIADAIAAAAEGGSNA